MDRDFAIHGWSLIPMFVVMELLLEQLFFQELEQPLSATQCLAESNGDRRSFPK